MRPAPSSSEEASAAEGRPKVPTEAKDGLLAALTLAPATWSRNRFFEMYKDPAVQDVRRRAGLLRSVVRHLSRGTVEAWQEQETDDRWVVSYRVASLGLARTVSLTRFEEAVLRVTLARANGEAPAEPWKSAVDRALARLDRDPRT
jgi:hypothetical protein